MVPAVSLSLDNIFSLSKNLIMPLPCEWGECDVVMNSWNSLLKHLYRHCNKAGSTQHGTYLCCLSKCAFRDHSSVYALQLHVKMSHMSCIAVPCLQNGCLKTFRRPNQMVDHLQDTHPDLLGIDIPISSPCLARFANPCILFYTPLPSPLPSEPVLWPFISSPVVTKAIHLNGQPQPQVKPSSRRWSCLDHQDDEDNQERPSTPFSFEDLSQVQNTGPQNILVQRQDPKAASNLSYPQSMDSKPYTQPPSTYSFQSLALQIAQKKNQFN